MAYDYRTDPNMIVHGKEFYHPSLNEVQNFTDGGNPISAANIMGTATSYEERLAMQEAAQKMYREMLPPFEGPLADQVVIDDVVLPGLSADDPRIEAIVVRPKDLEGGKNPCILFFFGGGMFVGVPRIQLGEIAEFAVEFRCVVVAPQYRLLPKWRYPAAVDDAEASLNWILSNAKELGVDPARIVTYGASSGGYLATCLAQRVKGRDDVRLAGEALMFPLLSDNYSFPSSNRVYGETWLPSDEQIMWNALLGVDEFHGTAPADAVPLHCEDYHGMPPTTIAVGDCDFGRDPAIAYAQGLMNDDILVNLRVWGGAFHGFTFLGPQCDVTKRAWRVMKEDVADMLTGKLVRG